ncbi:hypothetical protein SAMN05216421_2136 [Halopseudomonas xinjiangensis]|uniref:Uncharacterized protein n=1 Tax=Halopseudomonas xinjiangensis TaxID=487184 RepID=A0A1H1UUA3_9GAMM|nr:hypothetical protein SAMN05216421_2136 [Halopseudomonas xinjiangensis]
MDGLAVAGLSVIVELLHECVETQALPLASGYYVIYVDNPNERTGSILNICILRILTPD